MFWSMACHCCPYLSARDPQARAKIAGRLLRLLDGIERVHTETRRSLGKDLKTLR